MENLPSRRDRFEKTSPKGFFLEPGNIATLTDYLRRKGWLSQDESLVTVVKAGEGNMNLTIRVATRDRSFIIKQARPWVEKYPQIEAPSQRALVELAFYQTISERETLAKRMPKLIGGDPDSCLLAFEDLGAARDFTDLYAGAPLSPERLEELIVYLAELHRPFPLEDERRALFDNRAMRALNHEHLFRFPLAADNGLNLDEITDGLQALAEPLRNDPAYSKTVTALGERYLSEGQDGASLLHGDYFPGSWLYAFEGVRIIDPEFCFLGEPAFDLGVLCAHMHFARQPTSTIERVVPSYREKRRASEDLERFTRQFAGIEIMRRLLGVAQLPLERDLEEKRELLELSRRLVLES